MSSRIVLAVTVMGCGSGHGQIDSGQQAQVPPTIAISGVATARSAQGPMPISGVTVGAYVWPARSSATALATTDATGAFTVNVPTDGQAVEVFLETSSPSYVATYFYFPVSLVDDSVGTALEMMTPAAYAQAYTTTGVTHKAGSAMLEIEASRYGGPVPGVRFQTQVGTVKYTKDGTISATASMTDSDGIGFVLNAPADVTEVDASGLQFAQPIAITGYADALTMGTMTEGIGGD